MKKRLFSLLLVLCLVVSLLPVSALADSDTPATAAPEPTTTPTGSTVVEGQNSFCIKDSEGKPTTDYVYGGCIIEFAVNGTNADGEETYTATVRAATDDEVRDLGITATPGYLGKGATPSNSWDGNGFLRDNISNDPAPYWEKYRLITTKVVIKDSVLSLGGPAFTLFENVTELEWGANPQVTEIPSNFLMSSSIDTLNIPASVKKIGNFAFGKYNSIGAAPTTVNLGNP
jgi:hypothetical protein